MNRFACWSLFVAAGVMMSALGACSDSDSMSDGSGPGGTGPVEGGTVIPSMEAGADASDAADASLDVDAAPRLCSDDKFCHSVVPKGQNLRGVWGDGQGILWAFSIEGNVLRWDGTTWKIIQHLNDEEGIYSLWGSGPTDLWLATSTGVIHGTGASSASLVFAPVTLPGDATRVIKSIWGTGPNDIWAAGGYENTDGFPITQGRVLHYSGPGADGGGTWTVDPDLALQNVSLHAAWGSAGSGVWLQGLGQADNQAFATVLRRPPGASAWSVVDLPSDPNISYHPKPQYFNAASLSSDTSVWLAGNNGEYIPAYYQGTKVADGGFTWAYTKTNFWERPAFALWGTAPNDTWAVGQSGLVSHWDGTSWKNAAIRVTSVPVAKSFWGIWGISSDDFWIVGDEIALHKTNAGKP